VGTTDQELREALLRFIGDFANWDNAASTAFLETGRGLVKAAHPEDTPLVVDPFAGGGSIPLEALRLGCEAFASDLNSVACLILKTMLEDIPRYGPGLGDELRRVAAEIKVAAEKELARFYPADEDGSRPIAYLWARTVRCEASNCGAEIPIFKSAWLSKRGATRARFFREASDGECAVLLIKAKPLGGPVEFRIARGHGRENSQTGFIEPFATKAKGNNANVICPCCGNVLSGSNRNPRAVLQLAAQRGGADVVFDDKGERIGGARILAVVIIHCDARGRSYRLPNERDYTAVRNSSEELNCICFARANEVLQPVPNEPLPAVGTLGFRVQRYGMRNGAIFSLRGRSCRC
jgi:adenine-specific DNA methylase